MSDEQLAIPLSALQLERFAAVYCERWDMRSAAVQAGVPADRIVEALGSEDGLRAIAVSGRMSSDTQDAQLARAEEVRAVLWAILEDPKAEPQHRIRAADKLLKSYGGYVHRVQVMAPPTAPPQRALTDEMADAMRSKVLGCRPRKVLEATATEKKTA